MLVKPSRRTSSRLDIAGLNLFTQRQTLIEQNPPSARIDSPAIATGHTRISINASFSVDLPPSTLFGTRNCRLSIPSSLMRRDVLDDDCKALRAREMYSKR